MILAHTRCIFDRCKTLDASADGYVRAEGCMALALAPARSTVTAAVLIMGSAVGQDGRSSSLTAPNGPAQQRVSVAALLAAEVNQTSISGAISYDVELRVFFAMRSCKAFFIQNRSASNTS